MTDPATTKSELKKNWLLTESSFRQLLNWLDESVDSGGEKYLEMRRRLVAYFDRKNCHSPDELADETLNRVARRLEEEQGSIDSSSPAHYCYIVAKFVFLEYLRRTERSSLGIDEVSPLSDSTLSPPAILEQRSEVENEERRLNCLEQCLKGLELQNRELIIRYYQGDQKTKIENRRAIAIAAGITMNALGIRVCRIRNKLEACVCKCLDL